MLNVKIKYQYCIFLLSLICILNCNNYNSKDSNQDSDDDCIMNDSRFYNNINFQNQNNLILSSEIIGKQLFQLCIYHTLLTNQKQFKSLNLKLDNNFLQKISSIDLLDKIVNNKRNNKLSSICKRNKYYYKIKENIQNKIPKPILKIISNYMGNLLNATLNNQNTSLDVTKYNTEEYDLIQQLGVLHSYAFIENRIKEINQNNEINGFLLNKFIKASNPYGIYLTLSHPNIKKIIINNELVYNFHNPMKITKILTKNKIPITNGKGLYIYCHCQNCLGNKWVYQGLGEFDINMLTVNGLQCSICNNETSILNTLMFYNCKFQLDLMILKDPNLLPKKQNIYRLLQEKITETNEKEFIFLNQFEGLCYTKGVVK